MNSKIISTELDYVRCYSKEIENQQFIRLIDDEIKDMYSHNFVYLKAPLSQEDYISLLQGEIEEAQKKEEII